MPADDTILSMVVSGRRRDGDALVVTLRPVDDRPLPPWEPGAHIDVLITPEITRQYSLCGHPADSATWQIAVKHQPPPRGRGGSDHVHANWEVGTRVEVREPRNNFPVRDADDYLFIAGGIGITALKPMIDSVEAAGKKWSLAYCGRSLSTMALRDELAEYGDRVRFFPSDEQSRVDLGELLDTPVEGRLVYFCGPESLLEAVQERSAAWPPGTLQFERFTPQTHTLDEDAVSFEIELAESGLSLTVPPHKTILEVLEENGVTLLSSCRAGVCGTCETTVLEGIPDHRDSVLTDEERASNETMMVCVSRCIGRRLVLDI
ncbi:PDR/VanB family oxidoreductase [Subtercola lobariae]|nr:PDR/VanB family oxidoreductase [Subtercola lobariae]